MTGWVFAYGSLMWDPGMPVAEAIEARLEGYARSFCLRSTQYRGTPEAPGLVLGLDPAEGAACLGLALRIEAEDWPRALADLRERELVTQAYREEVLTVTLKDGRRIEALGYVMQQGHPQHAAGLSLEDQAAIIAQAHGGRGPNADYLFNTAAHLAQMGVADPDIDALAAQVRAVMARPRPAP